MTVDWDALSVVWFKYETYNPDYSERNGITCWSETKRVISHAVCLGIINGYIKYEDWMEKERFHFVLHGIK